MHIADWFVTETNRCYIFMCLRCDHADMVQHLEMGQENGSCDISLEHSIFCAPW